MKRLVVIWFWLFALSANAAESLTGIWSGYYRCNNQPVRLDLVLEQQDAQLQGLFVFYLDSSGTASGAFTLSGQVDEAAGTLVLEPGEWKKRPIGFTSVGLSGRHVGNQITGTISVRQCGNFQVTKDLERTEELMEQARQSKQQWEQAPIALADAEDDTQRCLAIAKWASRLKVEYPVLDLDRTPLNQVFPKAAPLFADEDFVPVWGQPFTSFSKQERKRVYYDTLTPCLRRRDLSGYFQGYNYILTRPFTLDRGEFSHSEVSLRTQIIAQGRQWLRDKTAELDSLPANEGGYVLLGQIRSQGDTQLVDLWPSERAELEEHLRDSLGRIAPTVLAGRVDRAVAEAADFEAVSRLDGVLEGNQELVQAVTGEQLARHRNAIAERQEQLVHLEIGRDLEALSGLPSDLAGLAQSTEWFRNFQSKYQGMDGPSVSEARQRFRVERRSLLEKTHPKLIQQVESVRQLPVLNQLVATYIGLQQDRGEPALRPVWDVITERRQQLEAEQQWAASNRSYCERFEIQETTTEEPSERDVCLALASTIDELNAGYEELGRKCHAREFRNDPGLAMQCMGLCGATGGQCELSFTMTYFENLDCVSAHGESGWVCDYFLKFTGNNALIRQALSYLAPNSGAGQGRFVHANGRWIHMR